MWSSLLLLHQRPSGGCNQHSVWLWHSSQTRLGAEGLHQCQRLRAAIWEVATGQSDLGGGNLHWSCTTANFWDLFGSKLSEWHRGCAGKLFLYLMLEQPLSSNFEHISLKTLSGSSGRTSLITAPFPSLNQHLFFPKALICEMLCT